MKKIAAGAAVLVIAAGAVTVYVNYGPWVAFREKRSFINDQMKDPGSTQFRNEHLSATGWLCGELNSKNGMGAYAGFKRFFVRSRDEVYLEGEGSLNKPTHDEWMELLREETEVIKSYGELRKVSPDLVIPSEYERSAQAKRNLFERKLQDSCA